MIIADPVSVCRVHIGTTHFVNAVIQRKHLVKVAVIRLCGKATTALPPLPDIPEDLKKVIDVNKLLRKNILYNVYLLL